MLGGGSDGAVFGDSHVIAVPATKLCEESLVSAQSNEERRPMEEEVGLRSPPVLPSSSPFCSKACAPQGSSKARNARPRTRVTFRADPGLDVAAAGKTGNNAGVSEVSAGQCQTSLDGSSPSSTRAGQQEETTCCDAERVPRVTRCGTKRRRISYGDRDEGNPMRVDKEAGAVSTDDAGGAVCSPTKIRDKDGGTALSLRHDNHIMPGGESSAGVDTPLKMVDGRQGGGGGDCVMECDDTGDGEGGNEDGSGKPSVQVEAQLNGQPVLDHRASSTPTLEDPGFKAGSNSPSTAGVGDQEVGEKEVGVAAAACPSDPCESSRTWTDGLPDPCTAVGCYRRKEEEDLEEADMPTNEAQQSCLPPKDYTKQSDLPSKDETKQSDLQPKDDPEADLSKDRLSGGAKSQAVMRTRMRTRQTTGVDAGLSGLETFWTDGGSPEEEAGRKAGRKGGRNGGGEAGRKAGRKGGRNGSGEAGRRGGSGADPGVSAIKTRGSDGGSSPVSPSSGAGRKAGRSVGRNGCGEAGRGICLREAGRRVGRNGDGEARRGIGLRDDLGVSIEETRGSDGGSPASRSPGAGRKTGGKNGRRNGGPGVEGGRRGGLGAADRGVTDSGDYPDLPVVDDVVAGTTGERRGGRRKCGGGGGGSSRPSRTSVAASSGGGTGDSPAVVPASSACLTRGRPVLPDRLPDLDMIRLRAIVDCGKCAIVGQTEKVEKIHLMYHWLSRELEKYNDEVDRSNCGESTKVQVRSKAMLMLKTAGLSSCYTDKIVGHVPGVGVGTRLVDRTEMAALGVHRPMLGGIDFITSKESGYGEPIAVSIVVSPGYYEDDEDLGYKIIYTGSGMNVKTMKTDRKRAVESADAIESAAGMGLGLLTAGSGKACKMPNQRGNQSLVRANLAMKYSSDYMIPVRVIRGAKEGAALEEREKKGGRRKEKEKGKGRKEGVNKTPETKDKKERELYYTYSGLYNVVRYWAESGRSGYYVYRFELRPVPGENVVF